MNIKIYIFICLSLLYSTSCSLEKDNKLSIVNELNNQFNQNELREIEMLVNFFDSTVLDQTHANTLDSSYHQYMVGLKSSESIDDLYSQLNDAKYQVDSF